MKKGDKLKIITTGEITVIHRVESDGIWYVDYKNSDEHGYFVGFKKFEEIEIIN